MLVVDSILASRVGLAQAIMAPRFQVETAKGFEEALRRLENGFIRLVIAEDDLSGHSGLELLDFVRRHHPETQRVLIAVPQRIASIRERAAQAGVALIVEKPWSTESLRRSVADVLAGRSQARWSDTPSPTNRPMRASLAAVGDSADRRDTIPTRAHELRVRGLLAGLNACESEIEVFDLIHAELVATLGVRRWIWVDEEDRTFTRVAGDWPVDRGLPLSNLSSDEKVALTTARNSTRVTRLDDARSTRRPTRQPVCVSLAIRLDGKRKMSCLAWVGAAQAGEFIDLLRDMQQGLQMAIGRIRSAEARAASAQQLAFRVSEELRMPVGALTHAIDRLRGEAERVGMPSEWVDRVTSETERVRRAVQQVEDEVLGDSARVASHSS